MSTQHTSQVYDAELETLRTTLSEMAGRAETQLGEAVTAVLDRHAELAGRVVNSDRRLDRLQLDAEELAVAILARRVPVADDLRELISAIKIAGLLERIGDYGKNIAKRSDALVSDAAASHLRIFGDMASETRRMILDGLNAFLDYDSARAVDVCQRDERVDRGYDCLVRTLLADMAASPQSITPGTHMLFVAKNLERIGDHATTIAECAYYTVEGAGLISKSV